MHFCFLAMFDTSNGGAVDIHQFSKMFDYINQWLNIFKTYDRNGSGLIDDQELNQGIFYLNFKKIVDGFANLFRYPVVYMQILTFSILWFLFTAFSQMGFNFSSNFTKQLTSRSNDHKEVSVDEFIVLCISIQRLTEAFRVRDTQQNGVIQIGFEDFLNVVLTSTN